MNLTKNKYLQVNKLIEERMNILIIGDSPQVFGGVVNYTRPLAQEMSKFANVYYLYNGTKNNGYDFGRTRIVSREQQGINSYVLINPKGSDKNYQDLSIDTGDWMNSIFEKFIIENKIDVIHINECFGFSSELISLAKKNKVKVVVTVHEYWWLCPHRVMVDFNKQVCNGPTNVSKCAYCIKDYSINNIKKQNTNRKISHHFPLLIKLNQKLKNKNQSNSSLISLEPSNINVPNHFDGKKYLEKSIEERLDKNISNLNLCDKVICVSSDVKRILTEFGVKEDLLQVQHIGSTIAENKISHLKPVDDNNITIGFIGGVTYYKGVHILVEAFALLPDEIKNKCSLKIYGKYDDAYFDAINDKFKQDIISGKVEFYGRYNPKELSIITNTIDISVLPSLCADTAPQTIFESFMAGLPVIAPRIGGFEDFVNDNENGLLYTYDSPKDLSEKLKSVVSNPKIIEKLRSNITANKKISDNVLELISLYDSI